MEDMTEARETWGPRKEQVQQLLDTASNLDNLSRYCVATVMMLGDVEKRRTRLALDLRKAQGIAHVQKKNKYDLYTLQLAAKNTDDSRVIQEVVKFAAGATMLWDLLDKNRRIRLIGPWEDGLHLAEQLRERPDIWHTFKGLAKGWTGTPEELLQAAIDIVDKTAA
jgi:hypothetical protein